MKEKIFIFDKYDNLLTVTNNYITAPFEEMVDNPVSFTIEFPMSDDDAEHLVGGNQVAFRDLKGNFRLFTIREVDDQDGEATEKIVECLPAINELTDVIVEEKRPQDKSAEYVLDIILENSRWQVGDVAELGKGSTSYYFDDAYESLGELTDIWGGEIVDRIEIDKNKIAGRYIDIVTRKGENKGKRFEIGKDIKNISRTVLYYPKTALYGKGSSLEVEDDDGEATGGHTRKITFRDVVWSKKNGDPVDKPKGQEWVGDPEALEKHGIPNYKTGELNHRFGMFEDNDEEDPETLLKKTWEAVQDEKDPKAQYEMDIETFYGVADYEHEQVFLGDTGIARDKSIKPMIIVESRVIRWKYDIGNPSEGELVLGNILDLSDSNTDIDWVIDKVKDNGGKWDAGGGPITDDKFPDKKPEVPKNVKVDGLYEVIMLSWDFESTYAIANYEVYASRTKGFVPDKTNLVFRGKVGGYNHSTETNEKWYFRVRAVNTHGTASDYTNEYSASTVKINFDDIDEENIPDFIEHSIFKDDEAPNPKEYKFWINTGEEPQLLYRWDEDAGKWKPLAPTSAKDLGAVEIGEYQDKINEIVGDIADKVDAKWVDGRLVSKANKDDVYTIDQLDNKFDNTVSKTVYETDKEGIVTDLESHESRIVQTEKDIKSKVSETEYKADKDSLEKSIDNNTSSIEQNAKSIRSKVDATTYESDKDGMTKDIKENKSEIEQNAKVITSKVDAKYVDGEIGKIEIGAENLLPGTDFTSEENINKLGSVNVDRIWRRDYEDFDQVLIQIRSREDLVKNVAPRITFLNSKFRIDEGETYTASWVATIGAGMATDFNYTFILENGTGFNISENIKRKPIGTATVAGYTHTVYHYQTTFIANWSSNAAYPMFGARLPDDLNGTTWFRIGAIKLEKGSVATTYAPSNTETSANIDSVREYASEIEQTAKGIASNVTSLEKEVEGNKTSISDAQSDIKQQAQEITSRVKETTYKADMDKLDVKVSDAESEIKQNAEEITSRVSKNGVISSIRQSPETVKIDVDRVNIDGDLNVVNGMVRIQKGVITNEMVAGSAKIDFAKIANVKITNAMIDSVVASKIKSGILDAEKVMVRVKSDKRAVQIDERGLLSFDNNSNVRIHIGVRNLAGKGQSDPATIRFFSGKGDNAAGIGMNVNDDFIIGSENSAVSTSIYSGKNQLYKGNEHRFFFNNGPANNYWEMKALLRAADGNWHPRMYPGGGRRNRGYIGTQNQILYRIYTNHIHAQNTHFTSSRETKTNIKDASFEKLQCAFDKIELKTFNFKSEDGGADPEDKIGVIAEDAPEEIAGYNEDGEKKEIDAMNFMSVIAGALKYQIKQTEKEKQSLHERIAQLEVMMNEYLGGN